MASVPYLPASLADCKLEPVAEYRTDEHYWSVRLTLYSEDGKACMPLFVKVKRVHGGIRATMESDQTNYNDPGMVANNRSTMLGRLKFWAWAS